MDQKLNIYNTLTKPTLWGGDMDGDVPSNRLTLQVSGTNFEKIFPKVVKTWRFPWKFQKNNPMCTKIIRNGPVTVVFWDDGTKTLVRRNENTPDDPYFAFCAALAKKVYGNNTRVKKIISENTVEPKERKDKE